MPLPSWFNDVRNVFRRNSVPDPIWMAIVLAESGGNPRARNLGTPGNPEDSVGLLQLNRRGGQGSGYTVEQLMNPVINAEIGARPIGSAVRQYGPDDVRTIAVNSGHPGPVPRDDRRIVRIAQIYAAVNGQETIEAAWQAGREAAGAPLVDPGDPGGPGGGGAGPPGLGEAIGRGIRWAVLPDWLRNRDSQELLWGTVFGLAGFTLIGAGLLGLALGNKTVRTTVKAAAAAIPQTRAVGAPLLATELADVAPVAAAP